VRIGVRAKAMSAERHCAGLSHHAENKYNFRLTTGRDVKMLEARGTARVDLQKDYAQAPRFQTIVT
jgi:hypothetical protein